MADENVYDEIESVLDREEASIQSEISVFDTQLDNAIAHAEQVHAEQVQPLQDRVTALAKVRATVEGLREQTDEPLPAEPDEPAETPDPTAPSDPAPAASQTTTDGSTDSSVPQSTPTDTSTSASSTDSTTPEPSPSQPSEPDAPATQPEGTEQPSTPSTETSPQDLPTPSDVLAADPHGVDASQPIAVPLSTGEVKVVTAGDVMTAVDPSVPDEALTTTQLQLRNSDLP